MLVSSSKPLTIDRPYLVLREEEAESIGKIRNCLTVFLTASTCPIGCSMCDLHQNTLSTATPRGAIPDQIDYAIQLYPGTDWIKLYNSGNFFDPRSIPPDDYKAILERLSPYQRVVVENHPKFGDRRLAEFRSRLGTQLEVAVGLETVQPRWLGRMGKRMTRDEFDGYARKLHQHRIDLRVFLIVGVPGSSVAESLRWAELSVRHAALQGARSISLIPARGNGTSEAVSRQKFSGEPFRQSTWGTTFGPIPTMRPTDLLTLQRKCIRWASGEVIITVDPWDLNADDPEVGRIQKLNLGQVV